MSWLRNDDDMLDHDKWRRAIRLGGDAVMCTWWRLTSWCSRRLTDGEVPADMVEEIAQLKGSKTRAKALRALVAAGLIEQRSDGGVAVVDYLQRNPSRAQVLAERERRAQSQKNRRVGENVTGHAPTSDPKRNEVPSQSRPVPSQSQEREEITPPSPEVEKREAMPRHPGPLKQTARDFASANPTGGAPALKYNWDPEWLPTLAHQARGFEAGLTDEDIALELEDCRNKAYPSGFKSEDHQFYRELKWAGDEKSLRKAKEARSGANWEKPGHQRQSRG